MAQATAWPPAESVPEDAPRVLTHTKDGVGYIVLNRPQKRNALDAATRRAMMDVLQAWRDDRAVRVVVITGAGKTFAAGADLNEMLGRSPAEQRAFVTPPHIYSTISDWPGPVIACVNGHALGAGCELMLACDVRIAGATAKMGQPEVGLGIIPGGGGTQRLPRLVGSGKAMYLILSGELLTGEEAERCGLVDESVPDAQLHARVQEFAEALAKKNPAALAAAKRTVRAAMDLPLTDGLRYEIDQFIEVFAGEDAKEGVRAFLERREPRWS